MTDAVKSAPSLMVAGERSCIYSDGEKFKPRTSGSEPAPPGKRCQFRNAVALIYVFLTGKYLDDGLESWQLKGLNCANSRLVVVYYLG